MTMRKTFLLLVLIAGMLLAALYLLSGVPLRRARESWLAGHTPAAIAVLERWRGWSLRRSEYDEALAAAYLTSGDRVRAGALLKRLAASPLRGRAAFPKLQVAKRLVARGAYDDFLLFDRVVVDTVDADDVALYRAAALAGSGKLDAARREFASIRAGDVDGVRYGKLRETLNGMERGSLAVVLDRHGKPLAMFDFARRQLRASDPRFASVVEGKRGCTFAESFGAASPGVVVTTAFDPEVQQTALEVMEGHRGSMVVIDVRSGELLAMASRSGGAPETNLAISEEYEPGSVIKVLTALNAIDSNVSLATVFPLDCQGYLDIDGIAFRDWARHDRLPTLNEAMATSCNVAFALLGFRLGATRIDAHLDRAGFGHHVDLGYCSAQLGVLHGALVNRISVGESSVGLAHETINTLHLALLADAVANGGVLRTPRVITRRVTILGDDLTPESGERAETVIGSAAAVKQVVEAMKAVVTDPRGTGRDAAVDGVSIAMKTGTAGTRPYNALIMAFAPAEHPRLAIGMILEHAGPAEGEGARVTHDFFEAMKKRVTRTED